jgi:acyl carrier protein
MTPAPVFETIADLLIKNFEVVPEQVKEDTLLEDLGLDSLGLMEFVFALEDAFNLRIPEDKLDPTQSGISLQQLSSIVQEALPKNPT